MLLRSPFVLHCGDLLHRRPRNLLSLPVDTVYSEKQAGFRVILWEDFLLVVQTGPKPIPIHFHAYHRDQKGWVILYLPADIGNDCYPNAMNDSINPWNRHQNCKRWLYLLYMHIPILLLLVNDKTAQFLHLATCNTF